MHRPTAPPRRKGTMPVADPARYTLLQSRNTRRIVTIGATVILSLGLMLLVLLTQATNDRALYERNYALLFGLNSVVAALLFATIFWVGARLTMRLRRGKFGSRLLVKLAAIFALVGVAPGVLIYGVSVQFVSRSIETWFDVRVEGALQAGLVLGRSTLDTLSSDLANKTRIAAGQLESVPDASSGLVLERLRDQLDAQDVALWTAQGQLIASAGPSRFDINPERPSTQLLRTARTQRGLAQIEGLEEDAAASADPAQAGGPAPARIRALAPVTTSRLDLATENRYLQVVQLLPPALVASAIAVQEANREYQERALARDGLRRMYIGTLTLSLFLAVFGALLLAMLLGNQLARPLLLLAAGVRAVAAGDLSPKAALGGKDELDGLTRSFADMTQQLSDARGAVEKSMAQLDTARANLQTILDNLTAGVLVLDADGIVHSSNPGATRILRAPLAAFEGRPLAGIEGLAEFAAQVQAEFASFLGERGQHGLDHWQQSFSLHASGPQAGPQQGTTGTTTLIARGAELPGALRLLVFDDISEIVSAQRAQAWGEVARRLAHEIKNPLTPIQLSAERLEMKLDAKLADPERAVLRKSVRTIVDQVDAMKRLVNEFRDYARLPAADLRPVDLNALVADVLHLYENAAVPVAGELDAQCPPVLGDAQQLRQVVHNLVQNAQDATEAAQAQRPAGGPVPPVVVRVHRSQTSHRVRLSVSDSGTGFPEHILKRAFEPYVTTKARGTGLGLAVVRKIADEHGARIDIANRVEGERTLGAQVSLSLPFGPAGPA